MFAWLKSTLFGGLGPALRFFASGFNPLIAIVTAVAAFLSKFAETIGLGDVKFKAFNTTYTAFMGQVGTSTFGQLPGELGPITAFCNHFLPLTEMVLFCGLASVLYTLSVAVRVIKGWIPTMN